MSSPALIANSDSLREAFGKTLSALGDEFPKLVVLDADIAGGTGVHHFRKSHPDRLIQFGIGQRALGIAVMQRIARGAERGKRMQKAVGAGARPRAAQDGALQQGSRGQQREFIAAEPA